MMRLGVHLSGLHLREHVCVAKFHGGDHIRRWPWFTRPSRPGEVISSSVTWGVFKIALLYTLPSV